MPIQKLMSSTQPDSGSGSSSDAAEKEQIVSHYNKPVLFYVLTTIIPWAFWLLAAHLSHQPNQTSGVRVFTAILQLAGLIAPLGVVGWLVRNKPALRADIRQRLLWPRGASPFYLACAVLLPLGSLLAAQGLSLLFGYSADQFQLRGGFSFTAGLIPVWIVLGLAALLEELAWHSYGTDALVTRMRLFWASLLFTVIWALWHFPLALIKGYYQAEVVQQGWLHALNFPLSMVAFVLIMNWLYYRTGRSIAVAVLFHASANYSNELFNTHPDSKLIQTVLFLIVAGVAVWRNRELFFRWPLRQ